MNKDLDFSELEKMLGFSVDKGILDKTVVLQRGTNKSALTDVYSDWLIYSDLDYEFPSQLEEKLDSLIKDYWTWNGSKEFRAMMSAKSLNPRTKDVFKSKSTQHTFPWYHRKRKY